MGNLLYLSEREEEKQLLGQKIKYKVLWCVYVMFTVLWCSIKDICIQCINIMFIAKSTLHFNFVVCTTAQKTKKDRRFIHFHKKIKCNKIQNNELPKVLPLFTASSAIKLRINKRPSKEVDGELCSRYFVVYCIM